ncbi:MAG: hypothetical protein ISEC1_P1849 [Thiomicrorhabdus sp.]|nr:MAG: hypothetical protein ISEC1_P1849 [Thiomicrorhabdus sp.]
MSQTIDSCQVKSMTAFSKTQGHFSQGSFSWEIRSVNHRYLEIQPKLPDQFRFLEMTVRETLKKQLARGKVDIFLTIKLDEQTNSFQVNQAVLQPLSEAVCTIQHTLMEATNVNPLELLKWPGVLAPQQNDSAEQVKSDQALMINLLTETVNQLTEHRLREGKALAALILQRCETIKKRLHEVQPLLPEILNRHIDKLKARIFSLTEQNDDERLHQEIAILAHKMDIDEELDRLATHLKEVQHVLKQSGAIGRRLDFLMQELNREANTLGSKSIDSRISQLSVELKVLIEQMREQVQNIE